ncbi:terpene synthase family protein [Nocardia sp. BMG111209]|uniref:terpene synthase family protein n=1 Tax=Nocardia sp. BMG111209 TaxID=1160137 RepID=UPI0003A64813|nr:terpene synthase family protein [Nocardia sp. BMG111209]
MAGGYVAAIEAELAAMRADHQRLVRDGPPWSLAALFSTPESGIIEYCKDFRPNRFGVEACAAVEAFCRRHGIWLEAGGAHYNSMTPFLHPRAVTAERMTLIGNYNAILFWLNDTAGREKFAHLTTTEQSDAHSTVESLCRLLSTGRTVADPTPVEAATAEFLAELTANGEPAWTAWVLESTIDHLRTAIRDQNARARGDLLSVEEYIDLRARVSGMYPAIALCEYGRDTYLPWDRIRAAGLETDLRRLQRLTADIGALMNDMFSFEKECIVDGADFNLIPIWLLNNSGAKLADAVHAAADIVRDRFTSFRRIWQPLYNSCAESGDPATTDPIADHLLDLRCCVQATWVWQVETSRYKGSSIFAENRQPDNHRDHTGNTR